MTDYITDEIKQVLLTDYPNNRFADKKCKMIG